MVFIFLAYFTLYNGLQFHPPHQNWFKWILFNGWVISHCVYAPQLSYPFVCWWASRLLPCPGYEKQCCDEHWGARVSFISGFLGVYAQEWDCWAIWQLYFQFFKDHAKWFSHVWLSVTPWTVAHQAPLSMGFSRQEDCSGLPCPPPRDPPHPGIKAASLMSTCTGRNVL